MNWHRLFGLLLTDFFMGSPYVVETERDLSVQQQRLDAVIVRKGAGPFTEPLPDGLEDLVEHNLFTFKSHQEPLDAWTLLELLGHYVAYRKLVSPATNQLLPESHFRLYAICSRFPHNLAAVLTLTPVKAGVYDCHWGTQVIRVIVVRDLAEVERNAPLYLFSGSPAQIAYGRQHYRQRSSETSSLLYQLWERYQKEGVPMSYTMADFRRDFAKEHFKDLTPEERADALRCLSPDEWRKTLQSLSPEQRLEGLSPEQRLGGLSPEQRLAGLSPEEIEKLLKNLQAEGPPET